MTYPIKINVSDIAALIDEHPYKSQTEVFQKLAEEYGFAQKNTETEAYLISIIPKEELEIAINSNGYEQLENNTNIYENKVKSTIISNILNNTDHLTIPTDLREKIKKTNNIDMTLHDTEIMERIVKDPGVQSVCNTVNTKRGVKFENASTDKFQSHLGKSIKERNSKCYIKKYSNFILAGRCDGLTDDAVIETKTRRRYWDEPPHYDIIQLRAYMHLCSKDVGYLNEQFPDGSCRSTVVLYDTDEWLRIENSIEEALCGFWEYVTHGKNSHD